ncbi:unnamed protein product [Dibothriocephalus latus]|uniref:F-box domain-containing protein n=1 Tax=Dibothriocephalus latus TaxID=60516 RepID=A0A3P7NCA4_DIBLA|nr:unnamed protein product [Dibothriocephalus latus]
MGSNEFCLRGDRVVPLSFEEVDLLFILEPIIESRCVSLERSGIEEIILKADVGISCLRCGLLSTDDLDGRTLTQEFGMVARLKFLPLLTALKGTLALLEISADLLTGCIKTREAMRQISSLHGQLVNVSEFVVNFGQDLDDAPFYRPTLRTADLRPFLEMFPSVKCLEISVDIWDLKVNLAKLRRACPCLKTLLCSASNSEEDWMVGMVSPWRLESFYWEFAIEFTVEDLYALSGCVQASYILLRLRNSRPTFEEKHMKAVFARMPCLRWLVLIYLERSLICSQSPDSQTVEIVSTNTASWENLCRMFPQLFGKLWRRHIPKTHHPCQPDPDFSQPSP